MSDHNFENQTRTSNEPNMFGIFAVIRLCLANKRRLFITSMAGAIVFLVIGLLIQNRFTAVTTLAPASHEQDTNGLGGLSSGLGGSGLGGLGGLALGGLGGTNTVNETIATLESVSFANKFVTENNLMTTIFYEKWDEEAGKWDTSPGLIATIKGLVGMGTRRTNPDGTPTPMRVREEVSKIMDVNYDPNENLVTISVEWLDPTMAADWANKIVTLLNNEMRNRAVRDSEERLVYLRSEMEKSTLTQVQAIFSRIIEREIQNAMLANTHREYALKIIDPAFPPDVKSWPSRLLLLIFGGLLGFVIGTMSLYTRALKTAVRGV